MTAISDTVSDPNFLSPLNFRFTIFRAPSTNFFIQKVNLPGISVSPSSQLTPFIPEPWGGIKPKFGPFSITFKVDEDLSNYLELYNWMLSYSDPDDGDDYASLASQPEYSGLGLKSDITLLLLDQLKNPIFRIIYVDAFPIDLTGIQLDTTQEDVNYVSCTCTFEYRRFYIIPYPGPIQANTSVTLT